MSVPSPNPDRRASLTQTVFILLAVGSIPLLTTLALMRRQGRGRVNVEQKVQAALDALDEEDIVRADALASELRKSSALNFRQLGGPTFVIGAARAIDADSRPSESERRRHHLIASRYLAEAKERGFPGGREKQGLVLLAQTTFKAQAFPDAIPRIEAALAVAPERATEFSQMLAVCFAHLNPPDFVEALRFSEQYLSDPVLSPEQRSRGQLQRAELLFNLNRFDDCLEQLSVVVEPQYAAERLVLSAQVHLRKADAARSAPEPDLDAANREYEAALAELESPQVQLNRSSPRARRAAYLLGECYKQLNRRPAALKQFRYVRRQYYGLPEALAATLEEADLRRLAGQTAEALDAYRAVLAQQREQPPQRNPLLSDQQLRKRLTSAHAAFFKSQQFESALQLGELLANVLTQSEASLLRAKTLRAWGDQLQATVDDDDLAESSSRAALATAKLREAGDAYAELAELRFATEHYPDDLFDAAQAYHDGEDFRNAVRLLDRFFAAQPKRLLPEAYALQGASLLSLNEPRKALAPLQTCIERFAEHPIKYDARLTLSRAFFELDQWAPAKQTLRDNLEGELAPESLAWRSSLYELGSLWYAEAIQELARARKAGLTSAIVRETPQEVAVDSLESAFAAFGKCIYWLDQAIERWPQDPRTVMARYRTARAHEHRSKLPRFRISQEQIESTRDELREQQHVELASALDGFRSMVLHLDRKQDSKELTTTERRILRNCYFAQADVLFAMERYEDAIQAYSSASNRYQDRPESLEAFVQISACYRRLDNLERARGTLEQAKVVLERIGGEADFAATTTRTSFTAWKEFLDWLSQT